MEDKNDEHDGDVLESRINRSKFNHSVLDEDGLPKFGWDSKQFEEESDDEDFYVPPTNWRSRRATPRNYEDTASDTNETSDDENPGQDDYSLGSVTSEAPSTPSPSPEASDETLHQV